MFNCLDENKNVKVKQAASPSTAALGSSSATLCTPRRAQMVTSALGQVDHGGPKWGTQAKFGPLTVIPPPQVVCCFFYSTFRSRQNLWLENAQVRSFYWLWPLSAPETKILFFLILLGPPRELCSAYLHYKLHPPKPRVSSNKVLTLQLFSKTKKAERLYSREKLLSREEDRSCIYFLLKSFFFPPRIRE